MNVSWMTLRDLEYLVSVADHEHFGRAAAACHVSQPALSGQIRKIEDLLGMKLFERTSRSVAITPEGRAVVEQARVVLEEAQKILALASSGRQPLSGILRLGAIATIGPYLMPHLLGPLKQAFPKLDLVLREGLTEQLLGELKAGQIDAVIASDSFSDSTLHVIPLFFEPFTVAVPVAHPLSKKKEIHRRDLRGGEMVLLEDGHCLRDQTLNLCPANRRGQIRQFHATSLETLRHLVAAGSGYTLMPQLAVRDDAQLKPLIRYRKLGDKQIGRNVVLVCRARFSRMADITMLARFIQERSPSGCLRISDKRYDLGP